MTLRNMAHDQMMAVNAIDRVVSDVWDELLAGGCRVSAYREFGALCSILGSKIPCRADLYFYDNRVRYSTEEERAEYEATCGGA